MATTARSPRRSSRAAASSSQVRTGAIGAKRFKDNFDSIVENVETVIKGKNDVVRLALVAILCEGHVLFEDLPGTGKSMLARAIAQSINAINQRVQCTPDMLPSDVTGTMTLRGGELAFRPGPVFTNVLLADEINRTPPKTQAALLEAMAERQVTVDGVTHRLDAPFTVFATQNPIEHEGTYPLPEAQVDRFMFKLIVTYPGRTEEREVLDRMTSGTEPMARHVTDPEALLEARTRASEIYADPRVKEYVIDLIHATRDPRSVGLADLSAMVEYGASPRAGIFLLKAAKAHAYLDGRAYVTPDDVKTLGLDVLRHRVILTYRADAEGVGTDAMIGRILEAVQVP